MSPALRAGTVLLAVAAAWAGVSIYSRLHAPAQAVSVSAGMASVPGPADLAPAERVDTPRIPDRLPAFSLKDLAGAPTPISKWADHPLVLNFWATWCAPCRREIPLLETLAAEWAPDGVAVVGIAVDHPDKVRQFAADLKINYPLLVGEQDALDVATQLGFSSPAFPFTVFTDGRGEVVTLIVGELHRQQADLIMSTVRALDRGAIALPDARRRIAAGV